MHHDLDLLVKGAAAIARIETILAKFGLAETKEEDGYRMADFGHICGDPDDLHLSYRLLVTGDEDADSDGIDWLTAHIGVRVLVTLCFDDNSVVGVTHDTEDDSWLCGLGRLSEDVPITPAAVQFGASVGLTEVLTGDAELPRSNEQNCLVIIEAMAAKLAQHRTAVAAANAEAIKKLN